MRARSSDNAGGQLAAVVVMERKRRRLFKNAHFRRRRPPPCVAAPASACARGARARPQTARTRSNAGLVVARAQKWSELVRRELATAALVAHRPRRRRRIFDVCRGRVDELRARAPSLIGPSGDECAICARARVSSALGGVCECSVTIAIRSRRPCRLRVRVHIGARCKFSVYAGARRRRRDRDDDNVGCFPPHHKRRAFEHATFERARHDYQHRHDGRDRRAIAVAVQRRRFELALVQRLRRRRPSDGSDGRRQRGRRQRADELLRAERPQRRFSTGDGVVAFLRISGGGGRRPACRHSIVQRRRRQRQERCAAAAREQSISPVCGDSAGASIRFAVRECEQRVCNAAQRAAARSTSRVSGCATVRCARRAFAHKSVSR